MSLDKNDIFHLFFTAVCRNFAEVSVRYQLHIVHQSSGGYEALIVMQNQTTTIRIYFENVGRSVDVIIVRNSGARDIHHDAGTYGMSIILAIRAPHLKICGPPLLVTKNSMAKYFDSITKFYASCLDEYCNDLLSGDFSIGPQVTSLQYGANVPKA